MTEPEILGASGPPVQRADLLAAAGDHLAETTAVLDADRVAGLEHLAAAADQARRVLKSGSLGVRDPSMAVLLCAAGTDQIDEALDRVGISEQVARVAVVALEEDEGVGAFLDGIGFTRDPGVLDADAERVVGLARERGHDVTSGDALDWLIEDAALVGLV